MKRGNWSIKGLLEAQKHGYTCSKDGRVFSRKGREVGYTEDKRDEGGMCYRRFTVNVGKRPNRKTYHPAIHQFVALNKYGLVDFLSADCVRHLNGNSLDNSWGNIALGIVLDNIMDREPEERREHAIKASSHNMRKDWHTIEQRRYMGATYNELSTQFGVSKGTLSYHFSETAKQKRVNSHIAQSVKKQMEFHI